MISEEIIFLATQSLSAHNDGFTKKYYRGQLELIRDYCNSFLVPRCNVCKRELIIPQQLDYIVEDDGSKTCVSCQNKLK